jgi:hypothetical protein
MSVGTKIMRGLDWTRLALGGAMLGGIGSNALGLSTELGPSMKRDVISAAIGFTIFLWILVDDAKKTSRAKAAKSMELDPVAASVENH